MDDKIILKSNRVWLAQRDENDINLHAKFVICDFGVNKNHVRLDRDTVEEWMSTLVNQPLLGRIKKSPVDSSSDFTGHNPRKELIKNADGDYVSVTTFDTDAFGTFTGVEISEIDGVECIVATAEIWTRFPKACQLICERIEDGTLQTSWELRTSRYRLEDGVKVVESAAFTGLCMLGRKVEPAYDSSKLLEVASTENQDDLEFDADEINHQEETAMKNPETMTAEVVEEVAEQAAEPTGQSHDPVVETSTAEPTVETSEEAVEETVAASGTTEVASLTQADIYERVCHACREKLGHWCYIAWMFPEEHMVWVKTECCESELDYVLFMYTVDGDEVSVDDGTPVKLAVEVSQINAILQAKDKAIASAAVQVASLTEQVAELQHYKDEFETAEAERKAREHEEARVELAAYAKRSGYFTEEEMSGTEISELLQNLDKAGINQLIASRYMDNLGNVEATTAEKKVDTITASLYVEEPASQRVNAVAAYLAL